MASHITQKVFIASTTADLADYRAGVIIAIGGLDGYEPIYMEKWGSRDQEPDSFCRQRVGECDLFIGIIGHCYGDCPKGVSESYTHREYREAGRMGKPRLMFVASGAVPVPASVARNAARHKKEHQAFRREVSDAEIYKEFGSSDDLSVKVLQAVHNWHQKTLTERAQRRADTLAKLTAGYVLRTRKLSSTLQHITEEIARTLHVERVGIWRFSDDRKIIYCCDLYLLSQDKHLLAADEQCDNYPSYFELLARRDVINIDSAQTDPLTAELKNYLEVNGIVSMMDIPFHLFSKVDGILCHEHVGQIRKWTPDEITFAIAIANLVSLMIEQNEQKH